MPSLTKIVAAAAIATVASADTIVDLAVATPTLSTLVTALTEADLVDTLNTAGTYTVFAPTNAAFDALPTGVLDDLLANKADLTDVLLYHVLGSKVFASDLTEGLKATTEQTDQITVTLTGGPKVNGETVNKTDIEASNGVVHIIDGVLLPPAKTIVDIAVATDTLSTLVAALTAADLVETLNTTGTYTVFAPTNAAFDALPAGVLDDLLKMENKAELTAVLLYHVLGSKVFASDLTEGLKATTRQTDQITVTLTGGPKVNKNPISAPDKQASNGVVHIIDGVLTPPDETIVDIAVAEPTLSTLVTALTEADLVDTLNTTTGTYTVFAPTNAAFDALPAGVLDDLLANKADLKDVLLYHVLNSKVFASDLTEGLKAATLQKDEITVTLVGGAKVNGKTISAPDNQASNGVVHIIDGVLTPPTKTPSDASSTTFSLSAAFAGLVVALGMAA